MKNETGFHDMHGIPIHVGDLIRVKHYKHYRNRRQMWLYFRVARLSGMFVVQDWHCLDSSNHQCLLQDIDCLSCTEVIADTDTIENDMTTFVERPRKKKNVLPQTTDQPNVSQKQGN